VGVPEVVEADQWQLRSARCLPELVADRFGVDRRAVEMADHYCPGRRSSPTTRHPARCQAWAAAPSVLVLPAPAGAVNTDRKSPPPASCNTARYWLGSSRPLPLAAERDGNGLRLAVETERQVEGCHERGVLAVPRGRRKHMPHDARLDTVASGWRGASGCGAVSSRRAPR
jgi:hypothetical protein